MEIEDIEKICKSFKGVTEDIKWEDHLCFSVGEKMFVVSSMKETFSFKDIPTGICMVAMLMVHRRAEE